MSIILHWWWKRKASFKIGEDVSLSEEEAEAGREGGKEEPGMNVCDSTAACLGSCSTSPSNEMASFRVSLREISGVTDLVIVHLLPRGSKM